MKNSITTKIIAFYLIIVISSLTLSGLLFSVSAKSYMESDAKRDLKESASQIAGIISKNPNNTSVTIDNRVRQLLRERRKNSSGIDDNLLAYITKDFKMVIPQNADQAENFKNNFFPKLVNIMKKKKIQYVRLPLPEMEYMGVVYPFESGWIVLYMPVGPIQDLSKGMLTVLIVSLLIVGAVAVVFGVFFAKSVAKPIIKLKNRAEMLSKRDFDTRVEINTGDELEELAQTIDKMAIELKEYDIAQKRFLQNASHELKTPLTSIQGYAEGIKDGVFEDNKHALEVIVEESTRLKSIVEELIFLSKLETMEDFYKFSNESLNEILEKSVEKVRSIAIKNDIKINPILFKDAKIKLDRDKFIQALINILGNCLRHASSEITITTSNDGKFFEIKIIDDGEGFDEKDIKNVFERFYKGEKGSTGLGLAITKVIVERHMGTIQAGNGKNGGAEFILKLPL